jgi:hypothetical protein
MRSISYRAPAKIILSGEHSVVYGKPALVSGFNLHCTITLHAGKGKKKPDVHMQKIYDIVFAHLKKQTPKLEMKDFRLQISNEIPVGRGMGSSAALSVAFVAAILHFYTGKVPDKEVVNSLAYQAEKPKRWYARDCEESDIRAAITEWQVLSRDVSPAGDPYSRMALFPKTGRTHQLRVHLAHIGHPIVADHLYAKERAPILGLSRTALHASAISFARESGEKVRYEVPLPADFKAAIE